MKRPTLGDVAQQAGVGIATVDRVLNKRARVSAKTAQRVLDAAEAIGFRASHIIRQHVEDTGKHHTLGFILQKRNAPFYRHLSRVLTESTKANTRTAGTPIVEFIDELTPKAVSSCLERMAHKADAIGLVAADHPLVRETINTVVANGTPVFTVLTDLPASERTGFIGIDNRMAGRTAAWTIARLNNRPGKVVVLMGSHRYQCQELCEMSFRSYFRENASDFVVIDDMLSLEDPQVAEEATLDLLNRHPDLIGIYVAGGGIEGVINALKESDKSRDIITVCNELTDQTRTALMEGVIDLVISHPRELLAQRLVDLMIDALEQGDRFHKGATRLPFELFLSENI
jgi:LacI family transcriptional regulator